MRSVVFGNARAARLCIEVLVEREDLDDIVVVGPPGGRHHSWHESIDEVCKQLGIRCLTPEEVNARSIVEEIASFSPDVIFSVGYTQILRRDLLSTADHAINFHPSLLPAYRGVAPLIRAIVAGESTTGVTAHEMTTRVDNGTIYGQVEVLILRQDTGYSLHHRAAEATCDLFARIHMEIAEGRLHGHPMPEGGFIYTSSSPRVNRLRPESQTMRQVKDIVRALATPLPGAYIQTTDGRLRIDAVDSRVPMDVISTLTRASDYGLFTVDTCRYLKVTDGILRVVDEPIESGETATRDCDEIPARGAMSRQEGVGH